MLLTINLCFGIFTVEYVIFKLLHFKYLDENYSKITKLVF